MTSTMSSDCSPCISQSPFEFKHIANKEREQGAMHYENNRLDTFKKWPIQAPISPERLAKAGFYYTGYGHNVKCFSCGLTVSEWSYGDIAMDKHKRSSPTCAFVNNLSENVPQNQEMVLQVKSQPISTARGCLSESSTVEETTPGELHVLQNGVLNSPTSSSKTEFSTSQHKVKPLSSTSSRGHNSGVTFVRGGSSGSQHVYKEINPTGRSYNSAANVKGIFMNGNSGAGATVTFNEINNPLVSSSEANSATVFGNCLNSNINHSEQSEPVIENHISGTNALVNHASEPLDSLHNGGPVQSICPSKNGGSCCYLPTVGSSSNVRLRTENLAYDRMFYEEERLRTFIPNWPLGFLHPRDLAKAGFYYLQVADKCRCAFCRGVLMNWTEGDVPLLEHHRNFPMCPFMMGYETRNIPTGGEDVCGPRGIEVEYTHPERTKVLPMENGSIVHKGPAHPSQATLDARLRSYLTWPSWSPMKPERLAEAGFFYSGIRDHTKCFYCDIGLCNWEPGDDAWIEHAHWSKHCAYVLLLKGEGFINSCQLVARKEINKNAEPNFEEPIPSPFAEAVDEAMRSSLVQNVLKTKVFPSVLVRKALLRKYQESGRGVNSVKELSEVVMVEMEESQRSLRNPTSPKESVIVQNVRNDEPQMGLLGGNASTSDIEQKALENGELSLEEELRQIKENRLCKICLDREIEVVFLPCGHQVACRQCALALKDCALCRKPVTGIVRTFLP